MDVPSRPLSRYFTPLPILGAIMWWTARVLNKRHQRRVAAGFEYLKADMQWSYETLAKFPRVALLAGVAAGLLGIGGGMVIGPLFLQVEGGMMRRGGAMITMTSRDAAVARGLDRRRRE